tara:strand:- start:95901 stop:96125 length:225 start_codon:yes stop_codon:yes gene_type:complete
MEEAPRYGEPGGQVYIRGINADGNEADITFFSFAKMGASKQNTLGYWVTDLRFNENGAPSYRIFHPVGWNYVYK